MGTNNFWLSVAATAAYLDQGPRSEETLNQVESEFMRFTPSERADYRRRMVLIVAALVRLEVRLMDSDGPLHSSI
jgi:hypothetical protein